MPRPPESHVSTSTRLQYVSHTSLRICRVRKGGGFVYVKGGQRLRKAAVIKRLTSLVIPPAWNEVRICSNPHGHLQATGRDARGRRQYLYHSEWRRIRDEQKFKHMLSFARALPKIRRRVRHDLRPRELTKTKVLAAVVRLLELSCIRVGNEEYARSNHSFGLTTLRDRHVRISGEKIQFHFFGKSGKEHSVTLSDARLARVVGRCQDIPGQMLFQYLDEEGRRRKIESGDVNAYLREISEGDFTAKDFRTWIATVQMVAALDALPRFHSKASALRNVNAAVQSVATRMGNTPTICRKCYVHPGIIDAYIAGQNLRIFGGTKGSETVVLRLLRPRGRLNNTALPRKPTAGIRGGSSGRGKART